MSQTRRTATHKTAPDKIMTRRRMITVTASAAGVAGLGAATALWPGASGQTVIHEWRGMALGAQTSIKLAHEERTEAVRMLAACRAEIERLEDIFSLYRPSSQIVRLNTEGELKGPSADLVQCLNEARLVSEATAGAFDVTVAPLWNLYAGGGGSNGSRLQEMRAHVDYRAVLMAPGRIALATPEMALTLNGIAQGYITDRVAELLGRYGFSRVLVSLGELRALKGPDDRSAWHIELDSPEGAGSRIELEESAVATSSAQGLVFDSEGDASHLIDPRTGKARPLWNQVSVVAASATRADALSTGLSFVERAGWPGILARMGANFAIGRGVNDREFRVLPDTRGPV